MVTRSIHQAFEETTPMDALPSNLTEVLKRFPEWLESYGETSWDHQSFFAGPIGGRAKMLYYKHPLLGTVAVSPMILLEAFLPWGRTLFWKRQRFPIADAHYAMGFAYLSQITQERRWYLRAVHFLEALIETRSPGFANYCWGYPFDWVTRNGVIPANTPFITTLPYVYEAFEAVHAIDGDDRWLGIMRSIAEHAANDIPDKRLSDSSSTCGYQPGDAACGVINASAYRSFLLMSAAQRFSQPSYKDKAERNIHFLLQSQNPNGSWYYAMDSERDFVDHFHTCFVLKALVKIEKITGHAGCRAAIEKGVAYYTDHLVTEEMLPKPFAKRPRLTVYRHELYDYAECINLGTLLQGRFPKLDAVTNATIRDVLARWTKPDGSFRARKLYIGWDNVPMHRWAQSQMFRSLCLFLKTTI